MANLTHDYNRLINAARTELAGATDAGIKQALFDVLDEFFTVTSTWQENIDITLVVDQTEYHLVSPNPGAITRLWRLFDSGNVDQMATLDEDDVLTLRNLPNAVATWTARVVKTVGLPITRTAQPEVPEWTYEKYGRTILHGVLARMMAQQNKPYSDLRLSGYNSVKFRNGMVSARAKVLRGHLYNSQAWRYPQSFRSRGQQGGLTTDGTGFNT